MGALMVGGVVLLCVTLATANSVRHNRINPLQHDGPRHRLFISRYEPSTADVSRMEYETVVEGKGSRFHKLDKLLKRVHSTKLHSKVKGKKILLDTVTPQWGLLPGEATSSEGLTWKDLLSDIAATPSIPHMNEIANDIEDDVIQKATRENSILENQVDSISFQVPSPLLTIVASPHQHKLSHAHRPKNEHTQVVRPINGQAQVSRPTNAQTQVVRPTHLGHQTARAPLLSYMFLNSSEAYRRMKTETSCSVSRPRVVSIEEKFPDPSLRYMPTCIALHRCSTDTGCCPVNEECTPKHVDQVSVVVRAINKTSQTDVTLELKFENHTACFCSARVSPRRDSRHLATPLPSSPPHICPKKFSVRQLSDGRLRCDCFDKQKDCIRLKKGKDRFTLDDHHCMKSHVCLPVMCTYGYYLESEMRCVPEEKMFSYWQ